MGAKESTQMQTARRLITAHGFSAYEAAARAGITRQAIYMAPWYKEYKRCATRKESATK